MDLEEERLRGLLHDFVPQPPMTMSGPSLREGAAADSASVERRSRWMAPLVAAGCVPILVAVALAGAHALSGERRASSGPAAAASKSDRAVGGATDGSGASHCNGSDLAAALEIGSGPLPLTPTTPSQTQYELHVFALRNVGSTTCTLEGYPTGLKGTAQIIDGLKRKPDPAMTITLSQQIPAYKDVPVQTIVLKPGDLASFGLSNANFPATATTRDLLSLTAITVPGDSTPIRLMPHDPRANPKWSLHMVGSTVNAIAVTPFVAGGSGP